MPYFSQFPAYPPVNFQWDFHSFFKKKNYVFSKHKIFQNYRYFPSTTVSQWRPSEASFATSLSAPYPSSQFSRRVQSGYGLLNPFTKSHRYPTVFNDKQCSLFLALLPSFHQRLDSSSLWESKHAERVMGWTLARHPSPILDVCLSEILT